MQRSSRKILAWPQAIENQSRQFVILRKDIFRENISGNKRENFSLAGNDYRDRQLRNARPSANPCSIYITGLQFH